MSYWHPFYVSIFLLWRHCPVSSRIRAPFCGTWIWDSLSSVQIWLLQCFPSCCGLHLPWLPLQKTFLAGLFVICIKKPPWAAICLAFSPRYIGLISSFFISFFLFFFFFFAYLQLFVWTVRFLALYFFFLGLIIRELNYLLIFCFLITMGGGRIGRKGANKTTPLACL